MKICSLSLNSRTVIIIKCTYIVRVKNTFKITHCYRYFRQSFRIEQKKKRKGDGF